MQKHPIKIRLFHPVRKNRSLKIARPLCRIPEDKTKTPSSFPRDVNTLAGKSRLPAKLLRFSGNAIRAMKRPVTRSFPLSRIQKAAGLLAAIPGRRPGMTSETIPEPFPVKFRQKITVLQIPPAVPAARSLKTAVRFLISDAASHTIKTSRYASSRKKRSAYHSYSTGIPPFQSPSLMFPSYGQKSIPDLLNRYSHSISALSFGICQRRDTKPENISGRFNRIPPVFL